MKQSSMKTYIALWAAIMGVLSFTACDNDSYLYKDTAKIWLSGDEEQNATEDSVFYSFKIYSSDVTEANLNVVVNLTGEAVDKDRAFKLEVVDEETNVPAEAYQLGSFVLPANAYKATVPVKVQRKVSALDLTKETAKLTLKVVATDDLGVGVGDYSTYKLVWCDYLIKPSSWNAISYYIGPFSQARYKFIIDFTGYTDFSEFSGDYNRIIWFQGYLKSLLRQYNEDPANEGREEGWPYLNDNGEALKFGDGLKS